MPDEDDDKDDPSVEGTELKKLLKKARTRDLRFAFVPAAGQEDSRITLHLRKNPKKLSDALRKPGAGGGDDEEDEEEDGAGQDGKKPGKRANKFTFGLARVNGKTLVLTCIKELPGLKKKMEKMLREEKIKMEVEVKVAAGGDGGGGGGAG